MGASHFCEGETAPPGRPRLLVQHRTLSPRQCCWVCPRTTWGTCGSRKVTGWQCAWQLPHCRKQLGSGLLVAGVGPRVKEGTPAALLHDLLLQPPMPTATTPTTPLPQVMRWMDLDPTIHCNKGYSSEKSMMGHIRQKHPDLRSKK